MEAGIHELTAGYALDALDADERAAYEAHLAGCESCRSELESFWQTAEALAVAASGPEPSKALRDRILADAHAEPPPNVVVLEPRRRRLVPVLAATAAVAAGIALALGVWGSSVSGKLDDTRSALERARTTASVLADPAAQTVPLQAGDGRLVVNGEGQAVLVVQDLAPAPSDKTYETWIVPDGDIHQARPAGLFPGSDRTAIVGVDGTVSSGDLVAVTLEPAGGVDAPTSPPVVASDKLT
jgi:anti-sigma factor RsiW